MALLIVFATGFAAAASAESGAIQFRQGTQCLAIAGDWPLEAEALALASCSLAGGSGDSGGSGGSAWRTLWQDGPDARGSPQIVSLLSLPDGSAGSEGGTGSAGDAGAGAGECINGYMATCSEGSRVMLHSCQGKDKHMHKANHYHFDPATQQIVAEWCTGSSRMCLVASPSGAIALGKCTDSQANGWVRQAVATPPDRPPAPPAPPAPPHPSPRSVKPTILIMTQHLDSRCVFAMGSRHLLRRGSQRNHISNPASVLKEFK